MARVHEMNFNTSGLLLMSDDVLLKYWRLDKFDVAKVWYPFDLKCSYVMPESFDSVTKECMFEGEDTWSARYVCSIQESFSEKITILKKETFTLKRHHFDLFGLK